MGCISKRCKKKKKYEDDESLQNNDTQNCTITNFSNLQSLKCTFNNNNTLYYSTETEDFIENSTLTGHAQEFYHNLEFLENIGEGSFGIVKKAFSKLDGNYYAIKLPKTSSEQQILKFNYEIEILKRVTKLNHPHINKLIYSANLNNDNMAIVLEWGQCSLRDILNQGRKYKEGEILRIFQQLCEALNECSKINICNRDLKPENIILNKWKNHYLISDFGEGYIANNINEEIGEKCIGTPNYMSLEMYNLYAYYLENQFSESAIKEFTYNPFLSDVQSLGIIIMELMGLSKQERHEIRNGINEKLQKYSNNFPQLVILLEKMMNFTPIFRPSFGQLLEQINGKELIEIDETIYLEKVISHQISKLSFSNIKKLILCYQSIERAFDNQQLCKQLLINITKKQSKENQAFIYQAYGFSLLAAQEYESSLKYFKDALNIYNKQNPQPKQDIVLIQIGVAQSQLYLGQEKEALDLFRQSIINYQQSSTTSNDMEFLKLQILQAFLHGKVKEFEMALQLLGYVQGKLDQQNLAHEKPIQKILRYQGQIHYQQKKFDSAENLYNQAITMNNKFYGKQQNLEQALNFYCLELNYMQKNEYAKAIDNQFKANVICRNIYNQKDIAKLIISHNEFSHLFNEDVTFFDSDARLNNLTGKSYHNGVLVYEGSYKNYKYNGNGRIYENNSSYYEGHFKNGILWEGKQIDQNHNIRQLVQNGFIKYEGTFKNEQIWNGKEFDSQKHQIKQFESGKIKYEGLFQNDKIFNGKGYDKNLKQIEQFENGFLKFKGTFKNDQIWNGNGYDKNENLDQIFENGQMMFRYKGIFKSGSIWQGQKFDKDNNLIERIEKGQLKYKYQGIFKNGEIWNGKSYDNNNQLVQTYEKGVLKYQGIFKNGQIWQGKEFDSKGNQIAYYLNGNISKQKNYSQDDFENIYTQKQNSWIQNQSEDERKIVISQNSGFVGTFKLKIS